MLGNTHLAVGVAASLALTQPSTAAECFISIMGGSIGGIVCDVDTIRGRRGAGAMQSQIFAVALTAAILILDAMFGVGIWASIRAGENKTLLFGTCLFAVLWILGYCSGHRSFTHSLAAMGLFTWAANMIYPPVCIPFLTAYASHLILDLLNKKPLRLFFPLHHGMCLGLFYADRRANQVLIYAGILISVFFILRLILT